MPDKCPVSKTRILDFLLDELPYDETVKIDLHLRNCEKCRSMSESYTGLFDNLRTVDSRPVDVNVYFQLKSKVSALSENLYKSNNRRRYPQVFSMILSAAAVLIMTFTFFSNNYLPNVIPGNTALYESWVIDSSIVESGGGENDFFDSLGNVTRGYLQVIRQGFIPSITIKPDFRSSSPDRLSDRYFRLQNRISDSEFLPELWRKSKIISQMTDIQFKHAPPDKLVYII